MFGSNQTLYLPGFSVEKRKRMGDFSTPVKTKPTSAS